MGNAMFGEQKTQKQIIREQKRMVERSVRALERDRASLERDEKKLILEIKKAAKANQMKSVKIQAKDLVRIRKHQEKFVNLTAQLRAISLQMTSMASTAELSSSMRKVTRSMQMMNAQLNLPQLQQVMREFAKQTESMDMKNEMIGDTIDDAMDNEENEQESDEVVAQVSRRSGSRVAIQSMRFHIESNNAVTQTQQPNAALTINLCFVPISLSLTLFRFWTRSASTCRKASSMCRAKSKSNRRRSRKNRSTKRTRRSKRD